MGVYVWVLGKKGPLLEGLIEMLQGWYGEI